MKQSSSVRPPSHSRTLFVIAHPDDEAMFFTPTILNMASSAELYLVCLSSGNNDGLGNIREKELYKSCNVLGIPKERVRLLDEEGLQDGFQNHWDTQLVVDVVKNMVEEFQISTVCFFTLHSYIPLHTLPHAHARTKKIKSPNLRYFKGEIFSYRKSVPPHNNPFPPQSKRPQ